jgi:hypothetical protein
VLEFLLHAWAGIPPAWRHSRSEWHAGEVSTGVLTLEGKKYIVVVGQHPTNSIYNGLTMIYDISAKVCSQKVKTVKASFANGR